MRYRVRHSTAYTYADTVDLASHMLHLSPRTMPGQSVVSAEIEATPVPSRRSDGVDHFGNHVTWLFMDRPHEHFEAIVQAVVDVSFARPPPADETPAWEAVAEAAHAGGVGAWEAAEFVFDSPMLPFDAGARAYAAESFPAGRPILGGLLDLNARIRREFAFKGGVTTIYTPVSKVLAQKAGVCQDFTHLMISGLRALGLPARYVSGYLRTKPPPGVIKRRGVDQSHAWVGCWLGPEHGWVDLDPTNDLVVREEHVVLAWGRDYGDISPVRGILLGGWRHTLVSGVELEPLET